MRWGGHIAEICTGACPRPPAWEVVGVKFVMICNGGATSRKGATRDLTVTYMALDIGYHGSFLHANGVTPQVLNNHCSSVSAP